MPFSWNESGDSACSVSCQNMIFNSPTKRTCLGMQTWYGRWCCVTRRPRYCLLVLNGCCRVDLGDCLTLYDYLGRRKELCQTGAKQDRSGSWLHMKNVFGSYKYYRTLAHRKNAFSPSFDNQTNHQRFISVHVCCVPVVPPAFRAYRHLRLREAAGVMQIAKVLFRMRMVTLSGVVGSTSLLHHLEILETLRLEQFSEISTAVLMMR